MAALPNPFDDKMNDEQKAIVAAIVSTTIKSVDLSAGEDQIIFILVIMNGDWTNSDLWIHWCVRGSCICGGSVLKAKADFWKSIEINEGTKEP